MSLIKGENDFNQPKWRKGWVLDDVLSLQHPICIVDWRMMKTLIFGKIDAFVIQGVKTK